MPDTPLTIAAVITADLTAGGRLMSTLVRRTSTATRAGDDLVRAEIWQMVHEQLLDYRADGCVYLSQGPFERQPEPLRNALERVLALAEHLAGRGDTTAATEILTAIYGETGTSFPCKGVNTRA